MPFNFKLPTTSSVAFQASLSSNSHPSLPLFATTHRGVLRNILKKHKRLPPSSQTSHLSDVLAALAEYIPYLLAIDSGLSGRPVSDEEIDISLISEPDTEWRACLTNTIPGRDAKRVKLASFEYEVLFTLLTLAETHYLLARSQLQTLYVAALPSSDQRTTAIQTAMSHYILAQSVFAHLHVRAAQLDAPAPVADVAAPTLGALSCLCLAEATLLAVLKDDPYPAAVVQLRNKADKEWMYKAPEMPKVRARLFANLCVAAADHAARGLAMLGRPGGVDEKLVRYFEDLRRAARGKACRFLGVDADLAGETGEAIAWLRGAKKELGFMDLGGEEEKNRRGLSRLKKDWTEKREDRKVEKGADWGSDAGRFEEGRVVDMLMSKWEKMNSTVNVQAIPASEPLLAKMPSGREYHNPKPWAVPSLDATTLVRMRTPPDPDMDRYRPGDDDSDEDDDGPAGEPVGAFPGTSSEYSGNTYY